MITTAPDTVSPKSVVLMFDDGSQLEKPEQKVGVSSLVGYPLLRSRLTLETTEFYQLAQKRLIGVKIHNENGTVNARMANSLKVFADCRLKLW